MYCLLHSSRRNFHVCETTRVISRSNEHCTVNYGKRYFRRAQFLASNAYKDVLSDIERKLNSNMPMLKLRDIHQIGIMKQPANDKSKKCITCLEIKSETFHPDEKQTIRDSNVNTFMEISDIKNEFLNSMDSSAVHKTSITKKVIDNTVPYNDNKNLDTSKSKIREVNTKKTNSKVKILRDVTIDNGSRVSIVKADDYLIDNNGNFVLKHLHQQNELKCESNSQNGTNDLHKNSNYVDKMEIKSPGEYEISGSNGNQPNAVNGSNAVNGMFGVKKRVSIQEKTANDLSMGESDTKQLPKPYVDLAKEYKSTVCDDTEYLVKQCTSLPECCISKQEESTTSTTIVDTFVTNLTVLKRTDDYDVESNTDTKVPENVINVSDTIKSVSAPYGEVSFDLGSFMLGHESIGGLYNTSQIRGYNKITDDPTDEDLLHISDSLLAGIVEEQSFWKENGEILTSTPKELSRQKTNTSAEQKDDSVLSCVLRPNTTNNTEPDVENITEELRQNEIESESLIGARTGDKDDNETLYEPSSSSISSNEDFDDQNVTSKHHESAMKSWNKTFVKYSVHDLPVRSARDDAAMFVERTKSPKNYDKKTFCMYCYKTISKFAIHLERKHSNIPDVQAFVALRKGSLERRQIIDTIRKNSNFFFNTCNAVNDGELIVCRRPNGQKSATDFTPCPNCKGYFTKNNIRHHAKKCYNYDGRNGRTVMVLGRKIAGRLHEEASDILKKQVFPILREDDIVRLIRYDRLLIIYANKMCSKYRLQHQHDMIRAHLRLLGRFLKAIKEQNKEVSDFASIYDPKFYDSAIYAVNVVAGFDSKSNTYRAPSTAFSLGLLLKRVGQFFIADCIKMHNENAKKNAENFLLLHKDDYGVSVNKTVAETQSERRRRKDNSLPTKADIQKMNFFLQKKRTAACKNLEKTFSYEAWLSLAQSLLTTIQLFNRRRAGEIERILIADFNNYERVGKELLKSLSEKEQEIANRYVRFTIRGKLMRTVPVLLSTEMLECVNILLKFRKQAQVPSENPFVFGLPNSDSKRHKYLRACNLMKSFASESGVDFPQAMTGTRLRKHIATNCIALNLSENEIADVANFMGHSDKIHKEHYRQPIVSREILRISKVLQLAGGDSEDDEDDREEWCDENNNRSEINDDDRNDGTYTIDEINDDSTVDQSNINDTNEDFNITATQECRKKTVRFQSKRSPKKKSSPIFVTATKETPTKRNKRKHEFWEDDETSSKKHQSSKKGKNKIPWNQEETEVAFQLFGNSIKSGTFPSLSTIRQVIKKYPCLNNRSAVVIKSWISNQIRKKK